MFHSKYLAGIIFFLIIAIAPRLLNAQQQITVVIDQPCNNAIFASPGTAQSSPVLLQASGGGALVCGSFTINNTSSGSAQVTIGNDGNNDFMALEYTKITNTSSSTSTLGITFSATNFNPSPSNVPPASDIPYQVDSNCKFTRPPLSTTLATNDTISLNGFLQFLQSDGVTWTPWIALGSTSPQFSYTVQSNNNCPTSGFPNFDFNTYNGGLLSPRNLKVQTSITLAGKDYITLPVLEIYNTAGGGPSRGTPSAEPSGAFYPFFTTSQATAKMFGWCLSAVECAQTSESEKVSMFVEANWEDLSQEMARGEGEYLVSLATLLRVPEEHRPAFFSVTQNHYSVLSRDGNATPDKMFMALKK